MAETIGKIIKRLRKERGWTQEVLAERLNITSQAVSKWESETGQPDIVQIVPLATVFGVSADVLFGIDKSSDDQEVNTIIREAREFCKDGSNLENCRLWRAKLLDGLNRYPGNVSLLMECIESGICLAYPKNDVYDRENGEAIYHETVKQAKKLEKYCKNQNDIMRANMITVLLHSAYGNFDSAKAQAEKFPVRCDMTFQRMNTFIAEFEQDNHREIICCQTDFLYHFEAMLDILSKTGEAYYRSKEYASSEYIFKHALEMIGLICKNEPATPPFHRRDTGDIYCMLAQVYLAMGERENALNTLETMAGYDTNNFSIKYTLKTPLLNNIDIYCNADKEKIIKQLLLKLNNSAFKCLSNEERYLQLLNKVQAQVDI